MDSDDSKCKVVHLNEEAHIILTCDSSVRFSRMDSTFLWNLINSSMSLFLKVVIEDLSSVIDFAYF